MKRLRVLFILVVCLLILVPGLLVNHTKGLVSEIDNRELQEIPKLNEEHFSKFMENYFSDRIGFREEFLLCNILINDTLFSKLEHPTYMYGKDGHIFCKLVELRGRKGYDETFENFVIRANQYLSDRDIEFMFVFNPSKSSVITDKLPEGILYENNWKDTLLSNIGKQGVNYVDNTDLMILKTKEGEEVFNRKYNAGHWNDLGAYYGVNNLLKKLNSMNINVKPHDLSEYKVEQKLNTSLPASNFAIHEYEPIFEPKVKAKYLTNTYRKYVKVNDRFRYFAYTKNEEADNDIRALIFQGSYMNSMGYKFTTNAFKELESLSAQFRVRA